MSQENILAIHSRRPGLGGLRFSLGMMRWSVDGGELQRIVADVDDVVPCPGWNTDAVSGTEVLAETKFVRAAAHSDRTLSLLNADDMIGILHDLKAHIGACRDAHDSHLHETTGPHSLTVMVIL